MIGNVSLQPTSIQGDAQDNYQIFAYDKNTDEEIEIWSTSEGWSNNCPDSVTIDTNLPMETSIEPLSEEDAEEFIGKYNDLIKDLLSATPFKIGVDKKAIYRVKEEKESKVVKSALPAGDSGTTFDKIYLNMNLSPEEMLKIFQSVEYRALSYDYKNHYVIHTLRHPDPNNNNGLMFQYTLQIIQLSNTQYNLVLSEWVYNSSDTKYILCSYDNGVVEWASDIATFVNSDGSLKTEWVGNKFWDEEYTGELGYSIGSENYQLIDLIYLQSTEEVYDYIYYQYTSNGWERYGVGVIPVKELPSAELPPKYIPVPNEGEICKIIWNQSISQKQLLTLLEGLPEEFWKDKDGNESYYYIFNLKVVYNGDPTTYYANENIYLRRESNSDGTYTYYLGGQDGSNFFTIFRISAHEGWIWNNGSYTDLLNNIFDNQANNNEQYYFMSEDLDGEGYKYGHYNHLLTDFVYTNNPEYDPNYKPVISQTVLYREDTDEGSKYYNFNGTNWNEIGAGGSSNAEPLTFELSSERQEGANELGSIRIGEDVWNIPQGGGSGFAPKKYEFSGIPTYLGDDLIPHLCGVMITDTEIIDELKKVINHEKTVQVYYGGGYDISKSSYLFTSAINFFAMDIITTGGLPSSGHGVAIIYANNQCYYCDTDFWNSDASAAITKTINLTFKFFELGNSSGGGNTSNSEGSSETLKYKTLYSFESVSGDTFTFPTNLVFEKDIVYVAIVEGFVFNLYYDAYDTINADGNVNVGGETYSIHLYHSGGSNTFKLVGSALSDNSDFPYTEHISQFDICQIVGGSGGESGGVSGITKNTYEVDPSNISIDLTTYVGGVKFVVNNDNGLSDFMFNNRDNMMKVKITTQVSISDLDAVINYEFNFSKTSSEVMFATVSGALQIGSVQLHFGGTGTIPLTASDGIGLGEIGDYFYNAEVSEHFFRFDRVNVYLGEQDGMTFSLIGFTIEAYSL